MKLLLSALAVLPALFAQPKAAPPKPFQAQSTSSISLTSNQGEQTVETTNVAYEVTGTVVPGRPKDERLVLRKTSHIKHVIDDVGEDASITLEAWPLGTDLKQKPLYSLKVSGESGETVENALWVASRGTEEVEWWSVYKLGNAQHLFDTYTPLLKFSISREIQNERYVGLEAPPDDAADKRLTEAHVAAVVTYASEDKVIREALLTCDDVQLARLLRSYADVSRQVSLAEGPRTGKAEPTRAIRIVFSENYPSPASVREVRIPVAGDDLDLAHATLPAKLHIAAWKR